ncbi:response regulator [Clostridium ihumii]|uniref:response regulator n=1 Tax=Clostridium ihumii TaxID=1470356 RepID=UPI00058D239B|nr:response regulator [Clostridium ihumii]
MFKILHIEQSDFFCKIVKQMLVEKGFSYICTDSFEDAYEILENEGIDLVISALVGKVGTIEEFLKKINVSNKSEIPIFVVSGNNIDDKKKELFDLGVTDYILKENLEKDIMKNISIALKEDENLLNLRHIQIAVVDDSQLEKEVQKGLFGKYNINNVDFYNSGNELFNSKKRYDMYLVDIVLQNEFGKDLIEEIRKSNRNSIIIAVTSLNNSKTLSSILNSGADDIINKPIDEELFISKLKSNARIYILNEKMKKVIKEMKK